MPALGGTRSKKRHPTPPGWDFETYPRAPSDPM
jgi:hypothetical protein